MGLPRVAKNKQKPVGFSVMAKLCTDSNTGSDRRGRGPVYPTRTRFPGKMPGGGQPEPGMVVPLPNLDGESDYLVAVAWM
jgi:hypothetical protein